MASRIDLRRSAHAFQLLTLVLILPGLFSVAGCSGDSTAGLLGRYLRQAVLPDQGESYTRKQVADKPHASLGLAIGASSKGLVFLEEVRGRDHRWVSGDPIAIVTRGPRILAAAGLEHPQAPADLTGTRFNGRDPADGMLHTLVRPLTAIRFLDFRRERIFNVRLSCRFVPKGETTVMIVGITHKVVEVRERCHAPLIHWRFTNVFWADTSTGRVWRSRQHVHPKAPVITMDVLRPSAVR